MSKSVELIGPPKVPSPDPALIRGRCPSCGRDVVSELIYTQGRGYFIQWRCVGYDPAAEEPLCRWRRVL
jgi:hypothetical protein